MGCLGSQAEPIVAVKTEYVEQRIPIQEAPKGVNFPPVEWFILTPDNEKQRSPRSKHLLVQLYSLPLHQKDMKTLQLVLVIFADTLKMSKQ